MNWHEWYQAYDNPDSDLSRRLSAVRQQLGRILDSREGLSTVLVSICAGDGRDTLPVLAASEQTVAATLIEYDPDLAGVARRQAVQLGLDRVEVRTGDCGEMSTYVDLPEAEVFMVCGVFGNMTDTDATKTIDALPELLTADATVLWTRGPSRGNDPSDFDGHPADLVRQTFAQRDFEEVAFIRPGDGFSVGVHRFVGEPRPRRVSGHLFTFIR